jgi:hypothetical protein
VSTGDLAGTWSKQSHLMANLHKYDWMWQIDADAFIMNRDIAAHRYFDLLNTDKDLVFSFDCNTINAGESPERNFKTHSDTTSVRRLDDDLWYYRVSINRSYVLFPIIYEILHPGVFFIKNSPWSHQFLGEWWELRNDETVPRLR